MPRTTGNAGPAVLPGRTKLSHPTGAERGALSLALSKDFVQLGLT
ncbi:hypothetical protein [Micromonospora sp. HM134]|nr:hypothetical protein [Micromonospora sp. HM134]